MNTASNTREGPIWATREGGLNGSRYKFFPLVEFGLYPNRNSTNPQAQTRSQTGFKQLQRNHQEALEQEAEANRQEPKHKL
jgi:hypothetical protein